MTTKHSPGKLGDRKDELYGMFAEGAKNADLAKHFNLDVSTITYHLKQWEKLGRPDPRPAAPAADAVPVPEPTKTVTPAPAPESEDRPATPEELRRLAAVLRGEAEPPAPPAKPQPVTKPAPVAKQPEFDVKVGQVYEGAVARVEARFILVDIIELANMKGHCPRGKVSWEETGIRKPDLFGHIHEGDLVNVKVLAVNQDPHRSKVHIDLSIRQAPPHPGMLPAEVEQSLLAQPAPASAPVILPPPAPVVTVTAPIAEPAPPPKIETPVSSPVNQSLCETCIHRLGPFCPFKDNYVDEITLAEEHKPKDLAHIAVVYGPRPVRQCAAYLPLHQVNVG